MDRWTPPAPRTSTPPVLGGALLVALCLFGGILAWRTFRGRPEPLLDPDAVPRAVTPRGDLGADEQATIEIFRRAAPSVVHITNLQVLDRSLTLNPMEIPRGTGTGFVWDARGYIVTNFHVVEGGQRWRVRLNDGTAYDANPVGGALNVDLAVLKIDAPEGTLVPIALGGSRDLQVGQNVFAIGNPFGLDTTLTTGVISGLDREIMTDRGVPIRGVVQTDAAINPGNSGGPLLDSAGRLIGVNTAIVSPSGAYSGIGFAIPVDIVNEIVPRLMSQGSIKRPGLGVVLWPDSLARRWGRQGAVIRDVTPGSSAEKAGLRPSVATRDGIVLGDVIVGLDDTPIGDLTALKGALAGREVGETVTLTVQRGRETLKVPVTLQALDE